MNPKIELEKLKYLKEKNIKSRILIYLACWGLKDVTKIFGSREQFRKALCIDYPRNSALELLKKLAPISRELDSIDSSENNLFEEIYQKFAVEFPSLPTELSKQDIDNYLSTFIRKKV